jgi:hypothetical protein
VLRRGLAGAAAVPDQEDPAAASAPDAAAGRRSVLFAALLAAATVAAFGLRLGLGLQMTGPLIPDELGYLAQARWLAGGEPMRLDRMPYYHVGHALLLTPAAFVGRSDPATFWTGVVATNALVGASVVPLLTVLLRRLLAVRPVVAVAAAFAVSCYPSYVVAAGQGWAESTVTPVFLLWVLALHHLLRRPAALSAVGLGLATTAVWAVHARTGYPVLGTTALVLALAGLRRWLPVRHGAVAAVTAGTSLVAVVLVQQAARQLMWLNPISMVDGSFDRLLTPSALVSLPAQLAGTAWNPLAATSGVIVLGAAALAALVRPDAWKGDREQSSVALTALAALLGTIGTWLLAAAFFVEADRADTFVYGRYVETVIALPFAAGVAWLVQARDFRRVALLVGSGLLLMVLCAAVVVGVRGEALQTAVVFPFNTSGVLLFGLDSWRPQVVTATVLSSAAGGAVVALAWWRRWAGLVVVLAVLCSGVVFVHTQLQLTSNEARYGGWVPPPVLSDADAVAITDDDMFWYQQWAYQFWVPGARFYEVDLSGPGRPSQRYVFAPPDWPGATDPGTRELWSNPQGTLGLFDRDGALGR